MLPHRTSVVHPGDRIEGRYRIIRVIAEGGMGTVFLAEHTLIKRRVAVKVLHPELAFDVGMIKRFLNEASAAGTLGHPNIVESTDMGFTPENVPFIVFEYLQGPVLTEEIYRVGGMPVRRALRIAMQIASALDAAHNADIIHLDLKSDNILLVDRPDSPDHVKVLDFGISKFMAPDAATTQPRVIMGTPEFMSPEQITAPEDVDARSDIYSLGVVLYEMLAARRPYADDAPRVLLHRIVHEVPPALGRANVPPALEQMILDRMLAKDPADRFSSMKEVHDTLGAILATCTDAPPAPPVAEVVDTPSARARVVKLPPAPAPRWPVPLLLTALLAGAGGGALLFAEQRLTASTDDAAVESITADAALLATQLEASLRATRQRADRVAADPLARSVIAAESTGAGDPLFATARGEVLQLFRAADGRRYSVLRTPAAAEPLAAIPVAGDSVIEGDANRIRMIASSGISDSAGNPAGTVTLATAVDLETLRGRLGGDALHASLAGLGESIELLPRTHPTVAGVEIAVPVAVPAGITAALTLHATVRPTARGKTLRTVRYASWGFGGLMIFGFVGIGLVRSRR